MPLPFFRVVVFFIFFIFGVFLGLSAVAQQAPRRPTSPEAAIKIVRENILRLYPDTTINEVSATPLPGIYEVVMGRNIAYTDLSGRYVIMGNLIDGQEKVDLTSRRKEAQVRAEVAKLPLSQAIRVKQGDGTRTLVVFTDPSCPFCRQIEPELEKVANVTIHYFLLPLSSDATEKSQHVWCAKDRAAAWKLAINGKAVPPARCQAPFDEITAWARRVGANGTPTLLDGTGRILLGFHDAATINSFLSGQNVSAAQ